MKTTIIVKETQSPEAKSLGVTDTELKEAQQMASDYFNNNTVHPHELGIYGYEAILSGDCKSSVEFPKPPKTSVVAKCEEIELTEEITETAFWGKVTESVKYKLGNKTFQSHEVNKAYNAFIDACSKTGSLGKSRKIPSKKRPKPEANHYAPARIKTGDQVTIIHEGQEIKASVEKVDWGYYVTFKAENNAKFYASKYWLETMGAKVFQLWQHINWDQNLLESFNEGLATP